MNLQTIVFGITACALGAAACSGSSDVGVTSASDSGAVGADSDASTTRVGVDGGSVGTDASTSTQDAASPGHDGGAPADGGATSPDSGTTHAVPVPTPVGACPAFQNGSVTFHPAAGARTVQLYLTASALSKHGPLVLYWYSTYGTPAQTTQALGASLQTIESLGGIIAAPVDNGTGQFPWLDNVAGNTLLADEIVGCAAAAGVDTSRIHALGFSAGALMTTQLAFARSSYLASVATYSGGLTSANAPPYQSPSNDFAALILTGGTSDNVYNTDFHQASLSLQAKLKADGHSALYCDHGGGHSIPAAYTAAVGQFFIDHPFGTNPSPYVGALPAALKSCSF